jgi:hypothetical protein
MHWVRYVCCVLLFGILFAACSGGIEQDTRTEAVVTLVMTDPETGAETDTVSKADPARLTATVTDPEGRPIVNGTVRFSTESTGVIEPEPATAVTDENGQAWVRLSAGSMEGVGTATVEFVGVTAGVTFFSRGDDKNYQLSIQLLNAETGEEIFILTENTRARLVATLLDLDEPPEPAEEGAEEEPPTAEGAPVPNQVIRFAVNRGDMDPADGIAVTDSNGEASVFLKPGSVPGAGVATATLDSIEGFTDTVSYLIDIEEDALHLSLGLVDAATGEAIQIVTSDTPAGLVATLTDEADQPVAGKIIHFSATLGILQPESGEAVTDSEGKASVFLLAGKEPGAGAASASLEAVSDTVSYFMDVTETSLSLSLMLTDAATGEEASIVTSASPGKVIATLTDEAGEPRAGETIQFSATLGGLLPADGQAVTDSSGSASVFLQAGTASGAGVVTAEWEGLSDTVSYFVDIQKETVDLLLRLVDAATDEEINLLTADTTGKAVASLTDQNGDPLPARIITFSTTLGTLQPGSGSVVTGDSGNASVFLLPGGDQGAGVLTATSENVSDHWSFFIDTDDPAVSISLRLVDSATQQETLVVKTGGTPVQVIATVTDRDGLPLAGATAAFSTTLGNFTPENAQTGSAVTDSAGEADLFLEAQAGDEGVGVVTVTYDRYSDSLEFIVEN